MEKEDSSVYEISCEHKDDRFDSTILPELKDIQKLSFSSNDTINYIKFRDLGIREGFLNLEKPTQFTSIETWV